MTRKKDMNAQEQLATAIGVVLKSTDATKYSPSSTHFAEYVVRQLQRQGVAIKEEDLGISADKAGAMMVATSFKHLLEEGFSREEAMELLKVLMSAHAERHSS